MPLLAGDIRFARSANMADVPEGGGPPSAQLLTSGASNEIFPDISEETRTVGRVEIYQIFGLLRNLDRAPLLGANVIIAEPPADPGVSITMLSLKDPFATRAQIARRIESGMAAASEWSGYLLEDHVATMRSVQFFLRPGLPAPNIGKTFVLVYQEGQSGERRQRVRIKNVTSETRIFSQIYNSALHDFEAQVVTCEIFDGLLYDFPGSPPSRLFARESSKTKTRETIYSDSGMFYGATRLTDACQINDNWLRLDDVYTQIVPNSRTEAASVDQRPAAQRTLVLAETPRRIEVGITPHTQRLKIGEENVGLVFVFQCRPYPSPGTLTLSYRTMGTWYTLTDDGQGAFVGSGSGSVNYLTGSLAITLRSVPDIGSSLVLSWGENTAFTNRAGSAGFRAPEYGWRLPDKPIKPGTLSVSWQSAGDTYSLSDDGTGALAGSGGAGNINYATGEIFLRPSSLLDAGGEFSASYTYREERTEFFPGTTPDAGGFATLTLADVPAPRSVTIEWATVRNVSATSGSTEVVSKSSSQGSSGGGSSGPSGTPPVAEQKVAVTEKRAWGLKQTNTYSTGRTATLEFQAPGEENAGTYTWECDPLWVPQSTGSVTVSAHGSGANITYKGTFSLTASSEAGYISVRVKDDAGTVRATAYAFTGVAPSAEPLPPADMQRQPSGAVRAKSSPALAGHTDTGQKVYATLEPLYQDGVGWVYSPPADGSQTWSAQDVQAGKTMPSKSGGDITYQVAYTA